MAAAGRPTSRIIWGFLRPYCAHCPNLDCAPPAVFAPGADLASGADTTFNAFSAMTLTVGGLFLRIAIDGAAQVFFYRTKFFERPLDQFHVEPIEDSLHHVGTGGGEPLEHRLRGRHEE